MQRDDKIWLVTKEEEGWERQAQIIQILKLDDRKFKLEVIQMLKKRDEEIDKKTKIVCLFYNG